MTREEREQKEHEYLFSDERYAKRAIRNIMADSLKGPAPRRMDYFVKGEPSVQSVIYANAWDICKARLTEQGKMRDPMIVEVQIECANLRGAMDNNTWNTILERTAGKVKEEISVSASQYEELSDEELAVIAELRERQMLKAGGNDSD